MKYAVSKNRKSCYHHTVSIYDFFESYQGPESKSVFIKVMKEFLHELMQDLIIEKKYIFKLPHGMPPIRVQKKKHKPDLSAHRVDWEKTKKLNKKIYHLNQHTGRYYFKFLWEKNINSKEGFIERTYRFYPSREHKRYLAKHIKKCASDPLTKDYDCRP